MKQKPSRVHKQVINYLRSSVSKAIEYEYEEDGLLVQPNNSPIWVCWWQGVDTAPPLVKQCIRSIKKYANGHPVYIITEENYGKWLDVPQYMLDKVESRKMFIANFSDYLRFSLLRKYGGMWIDATVFLPHIIPDYCFQSQIFTCNAAKRTEKAEDAGYIANGRWTSYCFGGVRNHTVFQFMQRAFEEYWRQEDASIDYLLVDYLLHICFTELKCGREIEEIPISNLNRNDLSKAMLLGKESTEWEQVLQNDTDFYKLSWRERYPEKTADGKESIYSYFCRMEI